MRYFFTSDFHLGHANIMKYCGRTLFMTPKDLRIYKEVTNKSKEEQKKFKISDKSLHHMNEEIIRRCNERVKKDDLIFFLGDYCLSGNSYIDTPKGHKLITKLKKGDKIYSVNLESKILEESKVEKVFKTKSNFRLHITLKNNHLIRTTENHPFAISKNNRLSWILAKNLKVGDVLFKRKDILLPTNNIQNKNYMLGYIFGYSYGDGSFSHYNIDIQSIDLEGLKRIIKYIYALYNIKLKLDKKCKNKYYRLKIPYNIKNSLEIHNLVYKPINSRFKQWYLGFMAGYFDAEGNCQYQSHNWYIRMGNTNKKLNNFTLRILKFLNLRTIIKKDKIYPNNRYKTYYHYQIKTKDTFNFFLFTRPALKRKYPNLKILSNGIKIKKIEKIYPKYNRKFINYNLSVSPNNNFFVKGILVHNCFKSAGGKGEGSITKADYWKSRFNCKNWIYIKGNHDKKSNSLKTIIERLVIGYGGKRINLVHDPERANVNYEMNFVGHIHNKWLCKRIRKGYSYTDCFNVGVDMHNFYPITFDEIIKKYNRWKKKNNYN